MRWVKKLAICVLITAAIFAAKPMYMLSKAFLAQYLLQVTWQQIVKQQRQLYSANKNHLSRQLITEKPWPWADTYPIAKLNVLTSQHDVTESVIVLSGFTGATMAFGPAWLQDSAQPNQTGNTIISAHNDSHFSFLKQAAIGDKLSMESQQGEMRYYQIDDMYIIDENAQLPYQYSNNIQLTLITCYPFTATRAPKTERLIVTAIAI